MNSRARLVGLFAVVATLAACTTSSSDGGSSGGGGGGAGDGGGGVTGSEPARKFFLPTGEPTNTAAPVVELDDADAIHAVYPEFVRGGAFYARCDAACKGPDAVKIVHFPTEGTVHSAMLALTKDGKPRVLLSTAQKIYWASCDADCTVESSWRTAMILDHGGLREVTGKALALDPAGRPRFVMHTYKAYLGVGQKTPETLWASCDSGCEKPSAWTFSKISNQMWRASQLRFDATGRAHLATVANVDRTEYSSGKEMGAYVTCASDCGREDSWQGTALSLAFESSVEAIDMPPAISLALTRANQPRIVMLGMFEETRKRNITYFACDSDCAGKGWTGSVLSDIEKVNAGIDLRLDANDRPRFVHTLSYDIVLAKCDEARCEAPEAKWDLVKVESGSEMKPDEIFLYTNCTVAAWFLHSPSLALTKDGRARVGYQARDISGGMKNPDPAKKPDCRAGTDMTWSRMALL